MRSLNRLLVFEIRNSLMQSLAICAILASGVATYVMATSTLQSLEDSRERYYRDYQFADAFVQVRRAPQSLAAQIASVPGVVQAQSRIVRGIIVDLPSVAEPVSALLISTPDDPRRGLNGVCLRRGRYPDPRRRAEVIVSEPFAAANRLQPGDTLEVTMGGRREQLRIVGVGMSPEYVYAVQPGQFMPDDRRFGIIWMPRHQVEAAFDMVGAFNDISLQLAPNVSQAAVIADVDRLTKRYGGQGAITREEQASHRRLADELYQLRGMAFIMPMIFLLVAAFLVNMVLARIVHRQQEQIATLRAFGYSAREIGWHYFKYILILTTVGAVAGIGVGLWLSVRTTNNYGQFFRFPVLVHEVAYEHVGWSLFISALVGILGGSSALRRAMRLPPAVAMRPESPTVYRSSILERLGLRWLLTPISLMVFRRLERNAWATLLSILSMSLAVSILVLGSFFEDTIDYVISVQFEQSQRQDVMIAFGDKASSAAKHDLRHLPGVSFVETFRSVPVRVRSGPRVRLMSLMGLTSSPRLFRILDRNEQEVLLPERGLVISEKLAEILGVAAGDELEVEFLDGEERVRMIAISSVFPNYTEPVALVNREELHRLLGESGCVSGAFLSVDTRYVDELYAELKQTPVVAGISLKKATIDGFNQTLAENLRRMRTINAIFASIIAFGTFYNCALITFAERSRDLATLRILGMTRHEVSKVLLGELAVMTVVAIPIGLPIGYALSYLTTAMMDTETHRFPLVISHGTFAYAAAFILVAAGVSALIVRSMMDRLDLLAVLKAKG